MRNHTALLLAFFLFNPPTQAADPSPSPADQSGLPAAQASIPFANHGGIWDWRVINDRTVLIQSANRQWYKATLFSPCINLPFAQRVGFESNPDGSFDKFSAIKLRHQTCPLISLVKSDPPRKKAKPHKPPEVTTKSPAAPAAPPPQ
jgi:Family of unknown function (DUF6491)